MGGAGAAMMFVSGLAVTAIVTAAASVYLSHFFLHVLQSTAAGDRELAKSEGNFLEWLWEPIHLVVIAGLWVAPALFAAIVLSTAVRSAGAGAACLLVGVWLFLPLGVLGSLTTGGAWVPVNPAVFLAMAVKPRAVLGFYLLTGTVTILAVGGGYLASGVSPLGVVGVPIGAGILGLCWVTIARLIGRLGFVISFDGTPRRRRRRRRNPRRETQTVPTVVAEPEIGEVTSSEETDDEEDARPYRARPVEGDVNAALPQEFTQPRESEMKLIAKDDGMPAPTRVWSADVFAFVLHPEGMRATFVCSAFLAVLAGLVRFLISVYPRG